MNRQYAKNKENQKHKYLQDLQQQEKFQKLVQKENAEKITGFNPKLNNDFSERGLKKEQISSSADNLSSKRVNRTIDYYRDQISSPSSQYQFNQSGVNSPGIEKYGRKHKNEIPFANVNIDTMGNIINGSGPLESNSNRDGQSIYSRVGNFSRSSNRNEVNKTAIVDRELSNREGHKLYNIRNDVKSSLEISKTNNNANNSLISIVGDYTPSQNLYMNNKRLNLNLRNTKPSRSQLKYHMNPLNNSIENSSITQMAAREYDSMLNNSRRSGINNQSITRSQKEFINRTSDLGKQIMNTRNMVNPITGDIAIPSISVKGVKEFNLKGYFK